ncbi:PEP-utilizing enzyme [Aeromonas veronii]|uniref:PEP-utilizing enzyme n=1 Tax=Aeromonas veronii TaxID=654 RepID=UPI002446722E|nr:PEP-utilizing enzyme [Aeromonas veronii]
MVTDSNKDHFSGAIIFIQSADPGYDWIFSYPIAGLVTAWGGANSHMAIRAGELGIPAIIGAGEVLFKKWSSVSRITINCAAKKSRYIELI